MIPQMKHEQRKMPESDTSKSSEKDSEQIRHLFHLFRAGKDKLKT
jgi:hypothetical protein